MTLEQSTVERFMKLFSGLPRAYGVYDLSNAQELDSGKRKGKAITLRADLLPEHYERHLLGNQEEDAIGVIPIQDDNTVEFAAIDIDDYKLDVDHILSIIRDNKLPLNPTRSKSGGMHLYVFCDRPLPAQMVKRKLEEIAADLGYPSAEVFPKQNNIAPDAIGNWINLPWFKHEETVRYAWNVETGEEMKNLEEWLNYVDTRKLSPKHFNQIAVRQMPVEAAQGGKRVLTDGPPCLQKMLERGLPEGTRNIVAYNLGVYLYKKHGSDDGAVTDDMTRLQVDHFDPPLPDEENARVLMSVSRADNKHYQCNMQPMQGECNRSVCGRRKYGVSDVDHDFGGLWHVIPISRDGAQLWEESSYRLQFTLNDEDHYLELTPEDLLKYGTVRTQALYRGVMIPNMDAEDWYNLIHEKLRNKEEEHLPEELTVIGELRVHVEEFFEMYANATEKRLISSTKAWHNVDESEYWVLPSTLPTHLKTKRRFTALNGTKLHTVLKEHFGMHREKRRYREGKGPEWVWLFPDSLTKETRDGDDTTDD